MDYIGVSIVMIMAGLAAFIIGTLLALAAMKLFKDESNNNRSKVDSSVEGKENAAEIKFTTRGTELKPWAKTFVNEALRIGCEGLAMEHSAMCEKRAAIEKKYYAEMEKKYGDELENAIVPRPPEYSTFRAQNRFPNNYGHSTRRVKRKNHPEVYMNMHWANERHSIILAQTPFVDETKKISTIGNFLNTINEYNACAVVIAGKPIQDDKGKLLEAPEVGKTLTFDDAKITTMEVEMLGEGLRQSMLQIETPNSTPRVVAFFDHFSSSETLPPTVDEFNEIFAIIKFLQKYKCVRADSPLIVMCSTGNKRSAVYALIIEEALSMFEGCEPEAKFDNGKPVGMFRRHAIDMPKAKWTYMRDSRRNCIDTRIMYVAVNAALLNFLAESGIMSQEQTKQFNQHYRIMLAAYNVVGREKEVLKK